MLEDLLRLLARGGAHTPDTLARGLGVSRDTLDRMLADLARLGYLEPAAGGCEAKCAGCPSASVCSVGTPQRIWTLTDKARRKGL
ncbi:MAG: MarR family transcriptional regulator [Chloroflexi bacterium]|nr:MarR family transcriptional regulator [Chloroflexota bacterium]